MKPQLTRSWRPKQKTFYWFGLLAVIYLLLGLLLPPNAATSHQYHLTATSYRVLVLFIDIPVLAIWFAAFYGYAKLDKYSQGIVKSVEGRHFAQITRGLRWLAWGIPISSIVSTLLGGIATSHLSFGIPALIINHYITLVISVVAFTIIGGGTRGLSNLTGIQPSLRATRLLAGGFIFLGMSYCFATIRVVQTSVPNPYQLPMWLILFTIVMPYLYAWLMGLLAAFELSVYRRHTRGLLYKRALNYLAAGITTVIFSSIIIQYFTSSSAHLRRITFNWLLLIVYGLLVIYAVGYVLIAVGAGKLKKLEEV